MPPDLLTIARRLATVLEVTGVMTDEHPAALQLITLVQRLDLADLQRERDELAAELEALRRAPPALPAPETPLPVDLTTLNAPTTKRRFRAKQQPVSGGAFCPECDRGFKNAHALEVHMGRKHKAAPAAEPPQPDPVREAIRIKQEMAVTTFTCPDCPAIFTSSADLRSHRTLKHPLPAIRLVDDDTLPLFVCSLCGSDAIARDLHQPDRCVRCAKRGSDAA